MTKLSTFLVAAGLSGLAMQAEAAPLATIDQIKPFCTQNPTCCDASSVTSNGDLTSSFPGAAWNITFIPQSSGGKVPAVIPVNNILIGSQWNPLTGRTTTDYNYYFYYQTSGGSTANTNSAINTLKQYCGIS